MEVDAPLREPFTCHAKAARRYIRLSMLCDFFFLRRGSQSDSHLSLSHEAPLSSVHRAADNRGRRIACVGQPSGNTCVYTGALPRYFFFFTLIDTLTTVR